MTRYYLAAFSVLLVGTGAYMLYAPICHGSECDAVPNVAMQDAHESAQSTFEDPARFLEAVRAGEFTLLDVREQDEWNAGHIEGARLIPLGNLSIETLSGIQKDTPVAIYCRSGRRAGEAEAVMRGLGFTNVRNVGGIIEWEEHGGVLVQE